MSLQIDNLSSSRGPELKSGLPGKLSQSAIAPSWPTAGQVAFNCEATPSSEGASWVKLVHPPSEYSFDEAMLLCQESPDTWVAWVPNYGEIRLKEHEFYHE